MDIVVPLVTVRVTVVAVTAAAAAVVVEVVEVVAVVVAGGVVLSDSNLLDGRFGNSFFM